MSEERHQAQLFLTPAEIEQVVRHHYGRLVVGQQRLGGEVDQNVWISTADGAEYLFKATRGHIDQNLRWQQRVLDHLRDDAPELPVPRLIMSCSGSEMVSLEVEARPVVARLMTWLHGEMLAEVNEVPHALLVQLGGVAGRLTQSLGRLDADPEGLSHHWDIRRSGEAVRDALPFVSDEDDRRCVVELMHWYDTVQPRLERLPEGVVHQDLNDFNVLASPDENGEYRISGILDINDSLRTVRVAELAIAVAYAMLRRRDPLEAAASVVEGFHAVARLSDDEISVVFPLAVARLCVNATTWTRRTKESHHPYGEDRMRHTWPTLRTLVEVSPRDAEAKFRAACRKAETNTRLRGNP